MGLYYAAYMGVFRHANSIIFLGVPLGVSLWSFGKSISTQNESLPASSVAAKPHCLQKGQAHQDRVHACLAGLRHRKM